MLSSGSKIIILDKFCAQSEDIDNLVLPQADRIQSTDDEPNLISPRAYQGRRSTGDELSKVSSMIYQE